MAFAFEIAEVALSPVRLNLDLEPKVICNRLGGGNSPPKVARDHQIGGGLVLKELSKQTRLTKALVVERNINSPLEAAILIPGRDAVANQNKFGSQNFSLVSDLRAQAPNKRGLSVYVPE